jgi:pyruvate kinase
MMEKMLRSGMNIARLNFSHGDFPAHAETITRLRAAAKATGKQLTIMGDLPGPKMRIGQFEKEPIELKADDNFTLTTDDIPGTSDSVSVTFFRLPQVVKNGDRLFLNDGIIELKVREVRGAEVKCTVIVGGELRSRKGLNLPAIDLGIRAFTKRDHECLKFAAKYKIDAISQSFVENAEDLKTLKSACKKLDYHPFIISKIERATALDHYDEILQATDGIMIARGDLGVEIPIEQMPIVQKQLMRKANRLAKPVITATQMLESMTEHRRPTRAEATDVANAILDGTDCVMLSGESAMGKYPIAAVDMLAKIATEAEAHRWEYQLPDDSLLQKNNREIKITDLITHSVAAAVEKVSPDWVFVPTRSGATARSLTRYRLPVWIIAVSSHPKTCQGLQFSSGVFPVCEAEHPDDWNTYIKQWLKIHDLKGNFVILTEGPSAKHPDANNRMEILDLREK